MTTRSQWKGGRRARAGVLAFAAVSLLLVGELRTAMAGEPTDQIRAHIAAMYGALGGSASAPSPSRMASVRKVADQMFDWSAMAKEALGDHWTKRTAEERNEFGRHFVNLFVEEAALRWVKSLINGQGFRVASLRVALTAQPTCEPANLINYFPVQKS